MFKCEFIKCSFSEAATSQEHASLNVTRPACHVRGCSLFSHYLLCHFSNSRLRDEVGERCRAAAISEFDGFLRHFGINLRRICCYRLSHTFTSLARRALGTSSPCPPPSTPSTLLVESTFPNAHVMNIFRMLPPGHI